jgi:hypothetical protein
MPRERRRDERNRSIVGQFVQHALAAEAHALERHGRREDQGQAERAREPRQPHARRHRLRPHRTEQPPRRPRPRAGHRPARAHDERHGVRLPDVHEDLMRVDQVIHRHRVEARLELLEEVILRAVEKHLHEPEQEQSHREQHAMPARVEASLRQNPEPEQQWHRSEKQRQQIPLRADQESTRHVGAHGVGGMKQREEDDTQQGAARHQRQQKEECQPVTAPMPDHSRGCISARGSDGL